MYEIIDTTTLRRVFTASRSFVDAAAATAFRAKARPTAYAEINGYAMVRLTNGQQFEIRRA